MNRRYLNQHSVNGDKVAALDVTSLALPAVPSAIADYVTARYVPGPMSKVILTLAALPALIVDEAGVGAYGGVKLLDFPQGAIVFHGAMVNFTATKTVAAGVISDTFDGDVALGTVTATNTALASKTLALTENGIIPYTAMAQAVAGVAAVKAQSLNGVVALTDSSAGTSGGDTIAEVVAAAGEPTASSLAETKNAIATLAAKVNALVASFGGPKLLLADGTTTAADVFLNFLIDDADHNVAANTPYLYLTGTVTLFYQNLGDY